MKRITTIFAAILMTASVFLPQQASAQAPQKMSYQAIVRNSSNALITSTAVGMQISILQGAANGTAVYVETQTPTTNTNGLVSLEIGAGIIVSGDFSTIDWANGPYFIRTETDPNGGANYTITGTSELLSVPYALFSANGTPGPQGPTGATGLPGTNGTNGAAGAAGPSGAQGATGNGFTNGTVANQMMFWNGSAWITLNPGVDGQILAICGGNLSWVTLAGICPGAQPQYPAGSIFCASGPTAIVDVTNPTTGRIWMDRNLGATQVATSSTDANSYGDLYQWGRRADGHQCRNSATTTTLSSVDQPANGNFILAPNVPYDWRSPQNTNLWQGVNGVNNPCPSGYRLPTETELNAERTTWSGNTAAGAFASPLKLPVAGYRFGNNGLLYGVGTGGFYWSSTVSSTYSRSLYFTSSNAFMDAYYRSNGHSVRCLKD